MLNLPFDSERKLMTVVVKFDNKYVSITKGAPDIIVSSSKDSKKGKRGSDIEAANNIQ